jgi:hypothetical protein
MLARVSAAWLIVLTLSPFTAPFPACDLTMLLSERAPAPVHATPDNNSLGDASLSPALPLFKPIGRVRLVALSESRTAGERLDLPASGIAQSINPSNASSPPACLTILRI